MAKIKLNTLQELEEFINLKQAETTALDYKKQIKAESGEESTGRIQETIAAMANTDGGTIIVGVSTNQHNSPENFTPLQAEHNYIDSLENTLAATVYPLPQFKVKIIPGNNPNECFLIVHVEKSKTKPHIILNGNHLLHRAGSQNKPMPLQLIERAILDRAKEQNAEMPTLYPRRHLIEQWLEASASIRVSMVPRFNISTKQRITTEFVCWCRNNRIHLIHPFEHIATDGVEYWEQENGKEGYLKIEDTGGIHYAKAVGDDKKAAVGATINKLAHFLTFGETYWKKIGYQDLGVIQIQFLLFGGRNIDLNYPETHVQTEDFFLKDAPEAFETSIDISESDWKQKLCRRVIEHLFLTIGLPIAEANIDLIMKANYNPKALNPQ